MFSFLQKLWDQCSGEQTGASVGHRAARPGSREVKVNLETLENRLVPAITFHGGPVLAHVHVSNVFYGQAWQAQGIVGVINRLQENSINQFHTNITKSPYMAMLGEYGVGRGQFDRSDSVTDSSSPASSSSSRFPNTVSEAQIQTMLTKEITAGRLPQETGSQLYFVYMAANTGSTSAGSSYGHHGSFLLPGSNTPVYYAVIESDFDTYHPLTLVASHELAESVTDPDVRPGGSRGWYDSDAFITAKIGHTWWAFSNPTYGMEIGDIDANHVAGQGSITLNGTTYAVQKEWSNFFGKSIVANGNQAGLLDMPPVIPPMFTNFGGGAFNNGGRVAPYYWGVGQDGRYYLDFVTAAGDLSGTFTIN